MSYVNRRKTDGPLSDLQREILACVAGGMTHAEISQKLCVSRQYVSENVTVACRRMGARSSWHAVATWARYSSLLHAARALESGKTPAPHGEIEDRVNEVLDMHARALRQQAVRMLP